MIAGLLAGLLLAAGWFVPGSSACAVAGWCAALTLTYIALQSERAYLAAYLAGATAYLGGFHWLFSTIRNFGGFGPLEAGAIFALFVVVSALQFPIWIFIFRTLPKGLDNFALRSGIAWVISEFISIRIFPWSVAHMQLAFQPLAQAAELGGVLLINLLLFGACEAMLRLYRKELKAQLLVMPALLCILVVWGIQRIKQISYLPGRKHRAALLQANISTAEKRNVRYFLQNTDRYRRLTDALNEPDLLVLWPESVIQEFIPANLGAVKNDPRAPQPQRGFSYIAGALTFDSEKIFYNSAIAVDREGKMPVPYHKRILMPFGEYTPLAGIFPWIREIHPTPDFTPGDKSVVFDLPLSALGKETFTAKLSPLICYEDIVPSLARDAVRHGAEMLVNLTNDAWFGDSVAAYQHNLIASFRAIENRRYLLRATNSGLTSIVSPLGLTVASLAPFSEGSLIHEVQFLSYQTIYTRYVGENLNWALLLAWLISLVVIIVRRTTKRSA